LRKNPTEVGTLSARCLEYRLLGGLLGKGDLRELLGLREKSD